MNRTTATSLVRHCLMAAFAVSVFCFALGVQAQFKDCGAASDFDAVIKTETQNLARDPNDVYALVRRASAYYQTGKQSLAFNDVNRSIRLDPSSARAFGMRATILDHQGKFKEAIVDFTRSLELDANYVGTYYSRGSSYSVDDQPAMALKDLQEVVKLDPNNATTLGAIGLVLRKLGRAEESKHQFNVAIQLHNAEIERAKIDRCNVNLLFSRGVDLLFDKQFAAALLDFDKTLILHPSNWEALYYRAWTHYSMSNSAQALKDLSRSIELNSTFALNYRLRASVYRSLREPRLEALDLAKFDELTGEKIPTK